MPAKKEESHDCKAECAELHKQLAALKKEIAALKKEMKSKSSGGADPRVDLLLETILTFGDLKLKNGIKSASVPSKRLASVDATQCIMPDAMRYIKIKTYPMTELKKLCTSLK